MRILDLKCCYGVRPGLHKNKTGLHSFGFAPFSLPSRQRELSPDPRAAAARLRLVRNAVRSAKAPEGQQRTHTPKKALRRRAHPELST